MPRQKRHFSAGATYHVFNRGNKRGSIFHTDTDRFHFLRILEVAVQEHGWLCHAYCLMDNHYHLLIETPQPNLATGMKKLAGAYTIDFNRSHGTCGHVFQGRYNALLVDSADYFLACYRYIVLNPVAAAVTDHPQDYRWSSYRATVGLAPRAAFLNGEPRSVATRNKLMQAITDGIPEAVAKRKDSRDAYLALLTPRIWRTPEAAAVPGVGQARA